MPQHIHEHLVPPFFELMVTLLAIQILAILGTVLTNLVAILTFTTDYWTIIVYDLVKVHSTARWMVIEQTNNSNIYIINNTNDSPILPEKHFPLATVVFGFENNLVLYKTHKGIFRQCNYLTEDVRAYLGLPKCRTLKVAYNQYNDLIHGMINPGREFMQVGHIHQLTPDRNDKVRLQIYYSPQIGLHNIVASCAISIILLLICCTLIGIIVGMLKGVVLATMTVGIIYLLSTMFSVFIVAIMFTLLKGERKQSSCLALEILTDQLCSARSIELSYSFVGGCLLIVLSLITSGLWLSLQEKQRKFAQH